MSANQNFLCPITQEVMTDPVIGSDGITYERTAIEAWFAAGHNTSPLTRAPMTSRSLVPNIALRTLIEESTTPAAAADPTPHTEVAAPPALTVDRVDDRRLLVTLSAPADAPTLPTLFIDVLDISGSMGSPAADTTRNTSDAASFSRADLVRHSVATQIELLRPQDSLALVLFDNNATVALPPTPMTNHGRLAAKSCLSQIAPRGGTNIWTGLQRALTLAEQAATANNVVIILQTDGESDPTYNPPRGIPDTFRAWLDAHPAAASRVTVHTVGYGFGRALDTPLLRRLAEAGRGTVNYIPDGSMVGTVFIHMMANLMSVSHRGLFLQIPADGLTTPVGFLQAGQTRRFLLTTAAAANEVYLTDASGTAVASAADLTDTSTPAAQVTAARDYLKQALHDALTAAEASPPLLATFLGAAATLRTDFGLPADHPLLTDLVHADPSKGQIAKAFADADNFVRWGRHYIPCVLSSLENEWAINFKDATSTHLFGTPVTRSLIDRGDAIFTTLPPPTPSAAAYSGYGGPRPTAPVSMASVHSSAGPCFLPTSRVKMADGTEKRCDEIQPGDIDIAGYRIRCVIKTLVPFADIVRLEDRTLRPADAAPLAESGGFTLWHPVFHGGAWRHPADVGTVERVQTDAIYNFVLEWDDRHSLYDTDPTTRDERPGVLVINGIMTCTLGHGMTGPVIGHPYFGHRESGKRNILDDLAADPGWATGYITWRNVQVTTDPTTGWIAGMTSQMNLSP
jgi:Mg-chelatase subunit ChlD